MSSIWLVCNSCERHSLAANSVAMNAGFFSSEEDAKTWIDREHAILKEKLWKQMQKQEWVQLCKLAVDNVNADKYYVIEIKQGTLNV